MRTFKNYLVEGKLKAEDYEAAIVVGFHKITGQKLDVEKSGIGAKTMSVLEKNPAALEAGERIAKSVKSHFKLGNAKAEQYGRAKSSLTPFWKSYGASDTTPKTDILIGDKRLSLKIGAAQLMSAGKEESLATFYAAVDGVDESLKKDKNYKLTEDALGNFIKTHKAPSQIRPLIKSGENPVVNKAEAAHKTAMSILGKLFENNRDFKIAFVREAMSGFYKYGKNSNSAAEYMLVASHDGTKVSIHSVYDDNYCAKIADASKLQIRFKTSQGQKKSLMSAKNPKGKTGIYSCWSVTSHIINAMQESAEYEKQGLNEIKILKKAATAAANLALRIFDRVRKKVKTFLKFVIGGQEPIIKTSGKVKF